jgi:hypothetical protein
MGNKKARRLFVQTKMLHSMSWEAQVWETVSTDAANKANRHVLLLSVPVFGTWRMADDAALVALDLVKIKEGVNDGNET